MRAGDPGATYSEEELDVCCANTPSAVFGARLLHRTSKGYLQAVGDLPTRALKTARKWFGLV